MAEEKKATARATDRTVDKPVDKLAAKAAPSRSLESAAASSDPAVHQLLAEIDIASRNDNAEEVGRLTEALADLGYE